EVRLEFLDPAADEGDGESEGGAMFPTGNRIDPLDVPGLGTVEATMINAGNPTIFVDAARLGLAGTELQKDINGNAKILPLGAAAHGRLGAGARLRLRQKKKTAKPVSWFRRFARTVVERSSRSPRGAAGHNPLRGREWPEEYGIPARYRHSRGTSAPCAWT